MINCVCCGELTKNPKFCSRTCSAKINNKIPKRKKSISHCCICGEVTNFYRRKYCNSCNPMNRDWNKITYGDAIKTRKYQKNSRVRNLSRKIYKLSNRPQCCTVCGYDTHFEVCHIKPISSFPKTTPVSEINHIDNLVALCPNHHWELDNAILILPSGFEPERNL
jgi:hypothetical protein